MRYVFLFLLMTGSLAAAQSPVDILTGKSPNQSNSLEVTTQQALKKMQEAALTDGIKIEVASGYRSFQRQREIWNGKYQKYAAQGLKPDAIFNKIVEYSTVPGTSRHHWGTDVDLIDGNANYSGAVLVTDKYHGDGPFCKLKDWMDANSSRFGFELVYTLNANRTGFEYEPWHYSYAPISRKYFVNYLTEVDFLNFLRSQKIMGMDQISDQRLQLYYKEHIQGINPELISEKK